MGQFEFLQILWAVGGRQNRSHIPSMAQVWQSGSGDTFVCPSCNAVYAVTITRLPASDQGTAKCVVCGDVMAEWNDTEAPSFELVKGPNAD